VSGNFAGPRAILSPPDQTGGSFSIACLLKKCQYFSVPRKNRKSVEKQGLVLVKLMIDGSAPGPGERFLEVMTTLALNP